MMENIYQTLQGNPLFQGIARHDWERVCRCLSARVTGYHKNEAVMLAGDDVTFVGLVLSGGVRIVKEDERGGVSMLTELSAPEAFGEILACAGIAQSPVSIFAAADTEILRLDNRKMIAPCSAGCAFHKQIIGNLLRTVAKKNFMLNRKIEILSKRTTREKLLCFFDLYRNGARVFRVPYHREAMAQYLCVDRSAMSRELCKMRDEGLIAFEKNKFELL